MATLSNIAKHKLAQGSFNWAGSDVRALLLNSSQATDPDRDFVSQLTGELAGTGYYRPTLANKTLARDDVNDRVVGLADAVVWMGINAGTPDRMVLYVHDPAGDAASWVIGYLLVRKGGQRFPTNGGELTVPPDPVLGYVYWP